jgi:hypothetical protein
MYFVGMRRSKYSVVLRIEQGPEVGA